MKNIPSYISRSFVEFGPFETAELLDFNKRGLLQDSDHIRAVDGDAWLSLSEWLPVTPAVEAAPAKKPAVANKVALTAVTAPKAKATKSPKKSA